MRSIFVGLYRWHDEACWTLVPSVVSKFGIYQLVKTCPLWRIGIGLIVLVSGLFIAVNRFSLWTLRTLIIKQKSWVLEKSLQWSWMRLMDRRRQYIDRLDKRIATTSKFCPGFLSHQIHNYWRKWKMLQDCSLRPYSLFSHLNRCITCILAYRNGWNCLVY